MKEETKPQAWDRLHDLAAANDLPALTAYIESLSASEALRAIFRLTPEDRQRILTTLSPEEAAGLIEDIPDEHAADIVEELPSEDAAAILIQMDSDDQADLLGEMNANDAEAILAEMTPEEAHDVRLLMQYDKDEAGGLMITEILAFQEDETVGQVLEKLSSHAEENAQIQAREFYVVSRWQRLIGVIKLNEIALARRTTELADLMTPASYVSAEADLEELEQFFSRGELASLPVIDAHARLIGVVTIGAVKEALRERADDEYRKLQGIVGGDEIRTMSLLTRSRRRLSWLSINIVLNIIAASVIAMYESTLSAVIALAVFLPIISDMSGCSGNQAVAVSMRELSLGLVKPYEVFRVWLKEVSVGLINGFTLGCLLGIAAWLWKGNIYLSIVVSSALAINSLIAVSIGGCVPLLLKRIGVDPAIASGPILTTVTDLCGFLLVLSIATEMLPLLTAG